MKAIIETVKPNTTFATKDVIKISVYPTSENHHQSVIKETVLEKKIKAITAIPKNAREKNLVNFIKPTNLVLAGYNSCLPAGRDDGSKRKDASWLDHPSFCSASPKAMLDYCVV